MDKAILPPEAENMAALILVVRQHTDAKDGVDTVGDIVDRLQQQEVRVEQQGGEGRYLMDCRHALLRVAKGNDRLRAMVIDKQSHGMGYHTDGLNAAAFYGPLGNIVAFLGTGDGEWSDNAIALIGQAQTNTYYQYDTKGGIVGARIIEEPVSSQQAQALDYFHRVTTALGWHKKDSVVVTGHSKGGNKAQFITLNSPFVQRCYSFCGQGFAPETLEYYRQALGEEAYAQRANKVYSISAANDFVNVMGERLAPPDHVFFLKGGKVDATRQHHELPTIIEPDGALSGFAPRGELSHFAEQLWADAKMSPHRAATSMTVMTACEHYFGNGMPIHGEFVSDKTLFEGGRAAAGIIVRQMAGSLFRAGVNRLSGEDRDRLTSYYDQIVKPRADSIRSTMGGLVDRALQQLGRKREERPAEAVQIGSSEPYFIIDTRQLAQAAERLAALLADSGQMVASMRRDADKTGGRLADVARQVEIEQARLDRCRRHLEQTVRDFEDAERELTQLARLVL